LSVIEEPTGSGIVSVRCQAIAVDCSLVVIELGLVIVDC
jgi:hypothetical protein